ncbi:MAG: hexosaminidase [Frankiaceae bacterium]|jgi:hypothetical protein|nr:hexosaminidase [Frankiaceae bacterium]
MTDWARSLVPRPLRVEPLAGSLDLSRGVSVLSTDDADLDGTAYLVAELAAAGIDAGREEPAAQRVPLTVGVGDEPAGGPEAYVAELRPDGIVVTGRTVAGAHHGAMTVLQVLRRAALRGEPVRCGRVVDAPRLAIRGYTDDLARGQVSTLADLRDVVAFLGEQKVTHYAFYLEDMFEFRSHPLIGAGRGRLTRAEVADLHAFARAHHVELVPAIQTLGHMERILGLPEYAHLRETEENTSLLGPDRPGAYDLIADLLADLAASFPSRYVVIGADEAFGMDEGSDRWLAHAERVRAIAAGLGKTAVVACDMFDTGYYRDVWRRPAPFPVSDALRLSRDMVPVVAAFLPTEKHDLLATLVREGYAPWAVTTLSNYTRLHPRWALAEPCIESFAMVTADAGGDAFFASSFCDEGGDNLRALNYQGIAVLSDAAWQPREGSAREATAAFVEQFYGVVDEDLAALLDLLGRTDDLFPRPPAPPDTPPVDTFGMRGWTWFHLWALLNSPPAPPVLDPAEVALLERSAAELATAAQRLHRARSAVRRNHEHLDLLEHALRWTAHTVERLLVLDRARSLAEAGDAATAAREVGALAPALAAIERRFEELWLRTNRPQGLDANLRRFARIREQYVLLATRLGEEAG